LKTENDKWDRNVFQLYCGCPEDFLRVIEVHYVRAQKRDNGARLYEGAETQSAVRILLQGTG